MLLEIVYNVSCLEETMRMTRAGVVQAVAATLLFTATNGYLSKADAETVFVKCIGDVSSVEVFQDGNVMLGLNGPATSEGPATAINRGMLCNLNSTMRQGNSTVCQEWLRLIQSAQLSGRKAQLLTSWDSADTPCQMPGTGHLYKYVDSVTVP